MVKGKMKMVFDCQEMPQDVKKYFFDHYGKGRSNDVYINVYLEGDCAVESDDLDCDYNCDSCEHRTYDIVEKWLKDNGAKEDTVIVKRWW